ncbi:MAG: ArnT family glycosyltransferase [Betaproteobacteria bacterium]
MPPAILVRYQFLFLAALTLLLVAPGIWEATGITGKDEFFLGLRTPMEMMASDHWLVPFLDAAPRIRKPPLLYWLGRGSFELFGASLVSARLVAVAFSALLVLATAGIGRRLTQDARAGLIAGCIVLGCLGLHTEGRRFMLDVPVAALSAAAFWALLVGLERRRWPWAALAAVLLAAGFLVKGPIVFLVFGGGVAGLFASGRVSLAEAGAGWRAWLPSVALFAALALPWFVIVRLLYPEAAALVFADEIESRRFFVFSPQILLGLLNIALPWVFVFAVAAWQSRRAGGVPRLLLVWFLVTFVPFLFLRSFDRYLIGSLVPLAIFTAAMLPTLRARWPFRLGLIVALLLGGALAVFAWRFHLGGWYWLLPAAAYLAWSWWRERALTHTLAAPAVFALALLWGLFPALGVNAVPVEIVELTKTRTIAFYNGPQPAMLPILTRQAYRHYSHLTAADAAELASRRTLVFAESNDAPALRAELAALGCRADPAGTYSALASHGSGLRFARLGATAKDWRTAWESRRLDPLYTTVEWFEVAKL